MAVVLSAASLLCSCTSAKIVSDIDNPAMNTMEAKTKIAAVLGDEDGNMKLSRVINKEINDTVFFMTFSYKYR